MRMTRIFYGQALINLKLTRILVLNLVNASTFALYAFILPGLFISSSIIYV
jgi:hypothetical protein